MALRATAAIGISKKDDKSIASGFDHAQRTSDNTFSIFFIDGSKVDLTIPLPENGVSVTGMTAIDARHFAWDFSDGTQSAPIEYPQAEVTISAETGNALVNKADGLYVSSTGVEISAETGNTLESKADGLFVGHDATKVDVNQTVANAGKALIVGADGNVTVGDAGVKVSTKAGNDIEEITDAGEEGIYVSVPVKAVTVGATDLTPDSTGKITVAIDPDTNNQISYGANGFLVEHDSEKVDVDQTVANAGKALVVGADGMVTTGDAGVKRSSKTGNSIEEITEAGQEGIYVPPIPKRSAKAGNALVELTDEGEEGLYVAPASISISQEENNALTSKADGLFAEGHEHEAYTTDEIDAFFTGTTEEIEAYSNLIKDTETSTLSIWSSKKTSDELDSKANSTVIGDLTDLETTEKTSVVGAVNEVNSAVSTVKDSLPTSIVYDEDTEKLTMYAGATVISSTTIVAGGGGGGGVELAEPTDVVATSGDEEVTLKWTDPSDTVVSGATLARWGGTVVVRKVGSAPTSKTDGTVVIDSKTRDAYKTTGYKDTGLTNGTKYYYGIFPYSTAGTYTYTKNVNVTPAIIYPDAATLSVSKEDDKKVTLTYSLPTGIASAELYWHTANTVSDTVYTGTKGITGTTVDVTGLTNGTTYYFAIYTVNAKGRKKKSAVVSGTPDDLKIVTFADGTWEEIGKMLDAHYAGKIDIADYWSVGDTKTGVSLSEMSAMSPLTDTHVAQDVDLVIIGVKHDTLATPINGVTKSAITIQMKNCLKNLCRMSSYFDAYSYAIYSTCPRRTWINDVFENALPSGLQSLIKYVSKKTAMPVNGSDVSTIENSNEKCFLASCWEIYGADFWSHIPTPDGEQYAYFNSATNRIKTSNNSNAIWWSRSGMYIPSLNQACFASCNKSGGNEIDVWAVTQSYGISVAMCL